MHLKQDWMQGSPMVSVKKEARVDNYYVLMVYEKVGVNWLCSTDLHRDTLIYATWGLASFHDLSKLGETH